MAAYTMTLLEYFQNYQTPDMSNVQMIENGRKRLFDFEYPFYNTNPADKQYFEFQFCNHFLLEEIGTETVGLFRLRLQSRLTDIMPKYVKLYESMQVEYNPLEEFSETEIWNETNSLLSHSAGKTDDTSTTDGSSQTDGTSGGTTETDGTTSGTSETNGTSSGTKDSTATRDTSGTENGRNESTTTDDTAVTMKHDTGTDTTTNGTGNTTVNNTAGGQDSTTGGGTSSGTTTGDSQGINSDAPQVTYNADYANNLQRYGRTDNSVTDTTENGTTNVSEIYSGENKTKGTVTVSGQTGKESSGTEKNTGKDTTSETEHSETTTGGTEHGTTTTSSREHSDTTSKTTTTGSGTSDSTRTDDGSGEGSRTRSGHHTYPADLIMKYRQTIININMEIFKELDPLFFQLLENEFEDIF